MRSSADSGPKLRRVFAYCLAAAVLALFCGEALSQASGGLRYVTRDDEGRKTADISGESVVVRTNDEIEVTNLRLVLFGESGATNAVVTSGRCICRLESGSAESESDVRIESGKLVVTGTGFSWDANRKVFKVMSHARVEAADLRGLDGMVPVAPSVPKGER